MASMDVAGAELRDSGKESLIQAMMDPAFYPKAPGDVTHKENHISHLFFSGDLVYKVKKAVRFSFLDYSTLAKRRYYLQQELQLNRRLAPSVYLGVMPIVCDESGWRLGGSAKPGLTCKHSASTRSWQERQRP
jgi:aminoglycoside phosphotransferase family enzyme